MEFPFDINQLFSERVSVLDQTLVGGRKSAGRPDLQAHIATVIDELGRASAKAQHLPAPITSASKMQSQRHQLYLLKDGESNGGRGVAVGFLKVGYKKLFLLDLQGVHIEVEPLCVLDFYIAENLQRHGYGMELFDFMLQHKNLEPVLMAYDRPSPKFLSFLAKHYCLTQSVPQVNNFVVFEGFFFNRSAAQLRKVPLRKPDGEIKPYSLMEREGVRQEQRTLPWPFAPPYSPQRSVSSQYSHSLSVGSSPSRVPTRAAPASAPGGSNRDQSPQSPHIDRCRARRTSQQGLVARCSMYSRHMDSRAVGLLDRNLAGLGSMGDQSKNELRHTDTHRLASIHTPQSRSHPPPSLPPLSPSKKDNICSQTSVDGAETHLDADAEALGAKEEIKEVSDSPQRQAGSTAINRRPVLLGKVSDRSRGDWSWTVGENCYTAQWVKQKQEYRSTRPW
ncbi:alpha-tubulin N-acetyltransferase 1 isoform X3 [Larimichthys crocea]|uniref:alpha-tubulin N-acetyltransferase 1 isoform X3 n=1 Tax=Larimichthys crocea TaxID=215358 RepID=UPI000F5D969C|nr:alpha-tubulin N-acetyltransferase 1 isoform X3 [Larimichthys crocea]